MDHKLIDTSTIKSEDEKRNCPKCGGAVSIAPSFSTFRVMQSRDKENNRDHDTNHAWITCFPQVFSAERVALKDQVYHKKCAVCSSCEKPLFTNNIYMEKNELFCDQCYRSVFILFKKACEPWKVALKALQWNVLFFFDAHAVLFALALLSGFLYKRSG